MVTDEITGYDFNIDIPVFDYSRRMMYGRIKDAINYQMKLNKFNQFTN